MVEKEDNTSDDIIELIDIVQDKKENKNIPPVVDFEDQLSGLLHSNSNKPISLDDAPGLDEILGSDKTESIPDDDIKISLDKIDSSPEDLDALLDNLFSEESDDASKEGAKTDQKGIFLEKALEGIDDIDTLLAEAETSVPLTAQAQNFSEVLSEEENQLSDLEEIEAILDSAMPEPENQDKKNKEQVIGVSEKQAPKIFSVDENKDIQKLEEEIQVLRKQVSTLELIVMDHEAEVEDLQEKNCKRLEALELQMAETLSIEKITEKVFSQLQGDIDKAAAEAAVRIIREEITSLKSK